MKLAAWLVSACAIAVVALAAAVLSLSPTDVVVYSLRDFHPRPLVMAADARASLWRACPRADFGPTTPVGAVVAAIDGSSPEQEASLRNILQKMLRAGCGLNDFGARGTTPLIDAVVFGSPRAVGLLLALGADPTLKSKAPIGECSQSIAPMTAIELASCLRDRRGGRYSSRAEVLRMLTGASGS